ncbi:MAG: uroporphyrinogen decarboxylase family protein [Brevinematia bacterium]
MFLVKMNPSEFRANYIRAIKFNQPLYIPAIVSILPSTWSKYRENLENLILKHELIFPGFRKGIINYDDFGVYRAGNILVDEWGCVWKFSTDGLQGIVVKHPLEDWKNFEHFKPPDIKLGLPREGDYPIPWDIYEHLMSRVKALGGLTVGLMPHGVLFLRLAYLRGYMNVLKDIVQESENLLKLIDMITDYNLSLIRKLTKLKVDVISFGDDLGNQDRLPFRPEKFRRILLPAYKKMFNEVKKAGINIRFHSDGHVIEIVEDFINIGANVVNIQDKVNGIDKIKEKLKGKVAIELDIDRQFLLPFGSSEDIDSYIRSSILTLGLKRGGLLFSAEVSHDVPLQNISALLDSLEKNAQLHLELD